MASHLMTTGAAGGEHTGAGKGPGGQGKDIDGREVYQKLFQCSSDGIMLLGILRDANGGVEDFIVHKVNTQWEIFFRKKSVDVEKCRLGANSFLTDRGPLVSVFRAQLESIRADVNRRSFQPELLDPSFPLEPPSSPELSSPSYPSETAEQSIPVESSNQPDSGELFFPLLEQSFSFRLIMLETDFCAAVFSRLTESMAKAEESFRIAEEKFRSILAQSFIGIALFQDNSVIYANDTFSVLFEIPLEDLLAGSLFTAANLKYHPHLEFVIRQVEDESLVKQSQYRNFAFHCTTRMGQEKWFEVYAKHISYQLKKGYLLFVQDISERVRAELSVRSSLKEKEVLLKEIHHRVKNNLQIISSLLNLQSQFITDDGLLQMFRESQNRIRAMALIHEKLYSSTKLSEVLFSDYITSLANTLFKTYHTDYSRVALVIDAEDIALNMDHAVPCGIILNELLSNALKYAFPDYFTGERKIIISLKESKSGRIVLVVGDTGIGLCSSDGVQKTPSLGLELVRILVEGQLRGSMEIRNAPGAHYKVTFKRKKSE